MEASQKPAPQGNGLSPLSRGEALRCENGWLSPEGVFYATARRGHVLTAIALGYEDDYAMAGWLRLSAGEWEVFTPELPEAQVDFVVEWCATNGCVLPHVVAWAIAREAVRSPVGT